MISIDKKGLNKERQRLHQAIISGDIETVRALIPRVSIHDTLRETSIPMVLAITCGRKNIVQLLIDSGVKVDAFVGPAKSKHKKSFLSIAAAANQPEIVELLLAAGAHHLSINNIAQEAFLSIFDRNHEYANVLAAYLPEIERYYSPYSTFKARLIEFAVLRKHLNIFKLLVHSQGEIELAVQSSLSNMSPNLSKLKIILSEYHSTSHRTIIQNEINKSIKRQDLSPESLPLIAQAGFVIQVPDNINSYPMQSVQMLYDYDYRLSSDALRTVIDGACIAASHLFYDPFAASSDTATQLLNSRDVARLLYRDCAVPLENITRHTVIKKCFAMNNAHMLDVFLEPDDNLSELIPHRRRSNQEQLQPIIHQEVCSTLIATSLEYYYDLVLEKIAAAGNIMFPFNIQKMALWRHKWMNNDSNRYKILVKAIVKSVAYYEPSTRQVLCSAYSSEQEDIPAKEFNKLFLSVIPSTTQAVLYSKPLKPLKSKEPTAEEVQEHEQKIAQHELARKGLLRNSILSGQLDSVEILLRRGDSFATYYPNRLDFFNAAAKMLSEAIKKRYRKIALTLLSEGVFVASADIPALIRWGDETGRTGVKSFLNQIIEALKRSDHSFLGLSALNVRFTFVNQLQNESPIAFLQDFLNNERVKKALEEDEAARSSKRIRIT
jgi:hypothetical protein